MPYFSFITYFRTTHGAAVVRRFRLAGARARRGWRPVHPGITVTKLHLTRARHRIPPGLCDAWFCGDSLPVRVGKSAARGVNSVAKWRATADEDGQYCFAVAL